MNLEPATIVAATAPPDDGLTAFLRALYPTDDGWIEVRALPSKRQIFVPAADRHELAAVLATHAAEQVYVGVATRRTPDNGTLENCAALHVVWVDVDFKTTAEADARTRLGTFPIPPHVVVNSGGGLHAYWRLREPFQLPADADAVKTLHTRLTQFFGADVGATDAAHVLRPPTTRNYKYDPPRVVVLESLEDGAVNVGELEEWLPPASKPPNGASGDRPFTVPPTITGGERNTTLYRSARSMHAKGWSAAAIQAALTAENVEKCAPRLPQAEVNDIAAHAATQRDRPDFAAETSAPDPTQGLEPIALTDGALVVAEGQRIAATGVSYVVPGLVPAYGMLGKLVAYAKVGKTSFALGLGAAVATGQLFLQRSTRQARVLMIAAEDPPEYTAWLARHLGTLPPDVLTFYRGPLLLNDVGLTQIAATVQAGGYGLVLIASWQAVVRGLLRDENDNAGAVRVVEHVKAFARQTRIPWVIDAHSGKGEDMGDDADPSKAMRGASGAAAAADYTLSLRYANGPFGSRRRLSGKGRFVSFAPLVLDYDVDTGVYTVVGTTKDAAAETTWRLLCETGALSTLAQSADTIALAAGFVTAAGRVTGTGRRQVREALRGRVGVRTTTETRRGRLTTLYAKQEDVL